MGRIGVSISFYPEDLPILREMDKIKRGLPSEVCRQAIRAWKGMALNKDAVKQQLSELELEDRERQAKREFLLSRLAAIESMETEAEDAQRQNAAHSEKKREAAERAAAEKKAFEQQRQAEEAKRAAHRLTQIDTIFTVIKSATNFPERFARQAATKFVDDLLPRGDDLAIFLADTAKVNGYSFSRENFHPLIANHSGEMGT